MNGRWYATATALGDGRIMTFSGLNLTGGTNNTVEIYDLRNAGAGWNSPVSGLFSPPLYRACSCCRAARSSIPDMAAVPAPALGGFRPGEQHVDVSVETYGSAVLPPLLPATYTSKVMNFGGGSPATSTTEIIDLSATSPVWSAGPSMTTGRIQMNAIILPNGKVLAEGGSLNNESPDNPGKHADLYDPLTNTKGSGGTASYSRLYHSTAPLLPDATVFSMGSNPGSRGSYEPAIEIYRPPYLFDANDHLISDRPSITGVAPAVVGYKATFSVSYTSTQPISSAVLVRPGSTTHAFDMEQHLIGLCRPSPEPACSGSGSLTLTTPPNGNIAPPGYYMLFCSIAPGRRQLQSSFSFHHATAPPRGTISAPTSDTTIAAGSSVRFSTGSTAAKYSWVFSGGSPLTSTA